MSTSLTGVTTGYRSSTPKDGSFASGGIGDEDGEIKAPAGITGDGEDNVYYKDPGNNWIQISKDGKFRAPTGFALDGEGNVYVADFGNRRIQVFDPEGRSCGNGANLVMVMASSLIPRR